MTYDFRAGSDEDQIEQHVWLCEDCMTAVRGGNLSRLTPERLHEVRHGIARLPLHRLDPLADHGNGMGIRRNSKIPCSTCGSHEPGTRYHCVVYKAQWGREEKDEPAVEPYRAPRMSRYNGKCKRCNRFHTALLKKTHNVRVEGKAYPGFITDENEILTSFGISGNGPAVLCQCGNRVPLRPVEGVYNPDVKCNVKCTNSKGFQCECSCAGKNHGSGGISH